MRPLYWILAVVGGISPAIVLMLVQHDQRLPGAAIDLGLLFFSLGLGLLFSPLGVAAGLGVAASLHWLANRWSPSRR